MAIEIREYTAGDQPRLITLIRELQAFESALFDRLKPPEEIGPWYVDHLLAECQKYDGTILVAAQDDQLIGYVMINTGASSRGEADEIEYHYAHVQEILVTQQHRGTGLGRRLLDECEQRARAAGAPWMRISVLSNNARALRTYQDFGFAPLHQRLEKRLD